MQGRMQAMIVASTLALLSLILPPVSIVSSASVALVTLRRGAAEGFYILFSACLVAALLGIVLLSNYQFALLYSAVLWLPVWVCAVILRESRYLALAIQVAVILGIFGVIGFYLFYAGKPSALWQNVLEQMIPGDAPVPERPQTIEKMARYMTGVVGAGSVFSLLFGLFLGRWWQALLYNPGGFKQEYLSLTTSPKLATATVIMILAARFTGGMVSEVLWNIIILLFVMYLFVGASVMHKVFASMKLARFLVPMFYVTLFLIPHVMLPIALVGLTDAWMSLRNKNSNQHTPPGGV